METEELIEQFMRHVLIMKEYRAKTSGHTPAIDLNGVNPREVMDEMIRLMGELNRVSDKKYWPQISNAFHKASFMLPHKAHAIACHDMAEALEGKINGHSV